MKSDYIKKIGIEVLGFAFYLYELHTFFYHSKTISMYDGSQEIFLLRIVLLLLALPVLYLFRVAYFFGWGDALSYSLSNIFGFDNSSVFFQVKLLYYAIYTLLSLLLFLEAIDYIYKLFYIN